MSKNIRSPEGWGNYTHAQVGVYQAFSFLSSPTKSLGTRLGLPGRSWRIIEIDPDDGRKYGQTQMCFFPDVCLCMGWGRLTSPLTKKFVIKLFRDVCILSGRCQWHAQEILLYCMLFLAVVGHSLLMIFIGLLAPPALDSQAHDWLASVCIVFQ